MSEKTILDHEAMTRSIRRIAHEIVERNKDLDCVVLLGIRKGGACLAERVRCEIKDLQSRELPLGVLDITLYRDDLTEVGPQPEVRATRIDFDVSKKIVILIDDVLFTGRTIRSAIDQIIDFGRPRCIQLATLIDRGHRELPIRPDFVGKNVPTSEDDHVVVTFSEDGKSDSVVLKTGEGS